MRYCKKSFNLPETYYDYSGTLRKTAENIDRFVLIPAGFNDIDRCRLGINNDVLTTTLLSGFRTGKTELRDYIMEAYENDSAIGLTTDYFSTFVPLVVNETDKLDLLNELVLRLDIDKISQDSINKAIENGNYYSLLAKIFVYSITNNETIFNEDPFTINVSKTMRALIDEFLRKGVNDAALQMLDSIYDAQWFSIDNNTRVDMRYSAIAKKYISIPFDDVVTEFIVEYENELEDEDFKTDVSDTIKSNKINNKQEIVDIEDEIKVEDDAEYRTYKRLLNIDSTIFEIYSIRFLNRELFRQLIVDAAAVRMGIEPILGNIIGLGEYSIKVNFDFADNPDVSQYRFDISFENNQTYPEDDIFAFSCALLRHLDELDDEHRKRASRLMGHYFEKRKNYLLENYGREKVMRLTCDLWRYRFHGCFCDFNFGIPAMEIRNKNKYSENDVSSSMMSVLIKYSEYK